MMALWLFLGHQIKNIMKETITSLEAVCHANRTFHSSRNLPAFPDLHVNAQYEFNECKNNK